MNNTGQQETRKVYLVSFKKVDYFFDFAEVGILHRFLLLFKWRLS